ncbi:hypothetical protein [Providencia sp. JUb39]|uniref:hypothetical protein n=1 Tax=Providencia sp. JUb39 TaxID=2724165 RepID=UPI00164EBEAD|nr:hypothetical protein [Providencia sp. JUb39]MBC5791127.1 hypothetical protein [Providencia sp. JUb39]
MIDSNLTQVPSVPSLGNIKKIKADINNYKKSIKDMKDNMLKPSVSLWVIFAASTFSGIPDDTLKIIAYILGFYFYYKVVKTGDSALIKKPKYDNIQNIKKSLLSEINLLPDGKCKKRMLKCTKRIQKKHENFFEKNPKSWFGIKRTPLVFVASYIFYVTCFLDSIYILI